MIRWQLHGGVRGGQLRFRGETFAVGSRAPFGERTGVGLDGQHRNQAGNLLQPLGARVPG